MAERGRPRNFDREKALLRAMEVFWQKGFEGASMTDLTTAMGIGSPSLYAAFGSKDGLFREAVELYMATEGAELLHPVLRARTAFEAVQRLLMESARIYTRPSKPCGCLVVLSALHTSDANEAIRRELATMRALCVEDLVKLLGRGVESGEIPAHADLKTIARFYITVQQGMSIQALDGADRATLEAIANSALAAWKSLTATTS